MARDVKVHLAGAPNFRDLGNIRGADGRLIKSGCVYRSESFHELTDADIAQLSALNVSQVVDLRSKREVERFPNRLPGKAQTHLMPIAVDVRVQELDMTRELAKNPTDQVALNYMLGSYRAYPQAFVDKLGGYFEALFQAPKKPLVFHCAAGKDRTGFLAAVTLRALGAREQDVLEDFLLTAKYWAPPRSDEALRKAMAGLLDGEIDPAVIHRLSTVTPEYLEQSFVAIDQQYGSFAQYLSAAGLTPDRTLRLQNTLLM